MVADADVGGQRLVFVGRLVHVVVDAVEQRNLCVSLGKFLVVLVAVRQGLVCAHLQLHHLVGFLVAFQLAFGTSQFGVNLLQSSVNELFGSHGHLVLVFIRLPVIANSKLFKVVDGAFRTLVVDGKHGDGCAFRRLGDA